MRVLTAHASAEADKQQPVEPALRKAFEAFVLTFDDDDWPADYLDNPETSVSQAYWQFWEVWTDTGRVEHDDQVIDTVARDGGAVPRPLGKKKRRSRPADRARDPTGPPVIACPPGYEGAPAAARPGVRSIPPAARRTAPSSARPIPPVPRVRLPSARPSLQGVPADLTGPEEVTRSLTSLAFHDNHPQGVENDLERAVEDMIAPL
ncbi:MAG: hypothetical protein M1826_000530 [Phylliscum demangeonii]|nr:MAG: hypothetical protein M1826_000530 [Phylliscum demangeonii]